MKKVIPIILLILSILALGVTAFALVLTIEAIAVESIAAALAITLAIIFIVIGFFASVIIGALSFIFTKSKLCIASGIISAVAMLTNIVSFLLLTL